MASTSTMTEADEEKLFSEIDAVVEREKLGLPLERDRMSTRSSIDESPELAALDALRLLVRDGDVSASAARVMEEDRPEGDAPLIGVQRLLGLAAFADFIDDGRLAVAGRLFCL